jgi:hypothetical protein
VVLRLMSCRSQHSVVGLGWRKVLLQKQAQANQVNADRLNTLAAWCSWVLDGVCVHGHAMDCKVALVFVLPREYATKRCPAPRC